MEEEEDVIKPLLLGASRGRGSRPESLGARLSDSAEQILKKKKRTPSYMWISDK